MAFRILSVLGQLTMYDTFMPTLLLMMVLSTGVTMASESMSQSATNNIPLNAKGKALLRQVETLYGTQVLVELIEHPDPYYGGQSDVLENGVPRVKVSRVSRDRAATLVHELSHLLWRFRGVPTRYVPASSPDVILNDETLQYMQRMFSEIRERVSHAMFFEDIRALGYDPSAQWRYFGRRALDTGDIDRITDGAARTNFLLQLLLESNDGDLVKQTIVRFRALGVSADVDKAQRLANMIRTRSARTGESAVALLVDVANELLEGRAQVAFAQWSNEKKGVRFVDRGAVILIRPSR